MLKSKGKPYKVEEPSHVKQLALNHVCKIGLNKQNMIRISRRHKCRILQKCNSRKGFPEDRLLGHAEKRFLKRCNVKDLLNSIV
jgi:hypothetical protein